MPYIAKAAQFAFSVESTEGTKETLAASDTKSLFGDITYDPDIPAFPRNVVSDTHDKHSTVMGGPRVCAFDFRMPLKGSGSAGTAPACDGILEALDMLGVNTSVSETYDTTLYTINKSLTMGWKVPTSPTVTIDTECHGCRGSGSIELNNGSPAVFAGHFMGLYNKPAAGTLFSSLSEETTAPPVILGGAFTIDSVAMKYRNFTINIENELELIDAPTATGGYSFCIVDQNITFSIDPMWEVPGTYDFFNKLTTDAQFALSLVIGSTAGNIITITAPKMQFTEIKIGERGYLTAECSGILGRNTDADPSAITIAFT